MKYIHIVIFTFHFYLSTTVWIWKFFFLSNSFISWCIHLSIFLGPQWWTPTICRCRNTHLSERAVRYREKERGAPFGQYSHWMIFGLSVCLFIGLHIFYDRPYIKLSRKHAHSHSYSYSYYYSFSLLMLAPFFGL